MKDSDLRAGARHLSMLDNAADAHAQRVKDRRSARPGGVGWESPHKYEIVGVDSNWAYGASLAVLRERCEADELSGRTQYPIHAFQNGLYRPLSFLETWQARVREFRANGNHAGPLLESWLETGTGIYYPKQLGKFKLASIANELLGLSPDFHDPLPVDYDAVLGQEFDWKNALYGQPLTRAQVLDHEGWNAVFEGNRSALEEASEIAFAEVERRYQLNRAMRFHFPTGPPVKEDTVSHVSAFNIENNHCSIGRRYDRKRGMLLVRVCPQ